MEILKVPVNTLLQNRAVYTVFEKNFEKNKWLNLNSLLECEADLQSLAKEEIIPKDILDGIMKDLDSILAVTND